jgi:hypothetical protein
MAGKTRVRQVDAKERIAYRLCAAALAADEALPHDEAAMAQPWRRELCNAADDYFAGEELPRNAPSDARGVGARGARTKGARR